MDYRFTNEWRPAQLDEIVAFLSGPRLWVPAADYPDFEAWADRAYHELMAGGKRAMVSLDCGDVVGVLVYQRHKRQSDAIEFKNLTVRPDRRGRRIASFLLRNAEIEAVREFGCRAAIADAKVSNAAIHFFMTRNQYQTVGRRDLYGLETGDDLIYSKTLSSGGILT